MKIARYENKTSSYSSPFITEVSEHMESKNSDYVRVSSIEEVEFLERDPSEVVLEKLQALRAEKIAKMEDYDERISKLLAITYIPEDNVEPLTNPNEGLVGEEEGT